jgi:hypothetical protein
VLAHNATAPLQALNPTIGFAASLLAVWCQILLLATISLSPLAIGADPIGDVPICHTDDGTQPAQQKPSYPAHDLRPVCALPVARIAAGHPVADANASGAAVWRHRAA